MVARAGHCGRLIVRKLLPSRWRHIDECCAFIGLPEEPMKVYCRSWMSTAARSSQWYSASSDTSGMWCDALENVWRKWLCKGALRVNVQEEDLPGHGCKTYWRQQDAHLVRCSEVTTETTGENWSIQRPTIRTNDGLKEEEEEWCYIFAMSSVVKYLKYKYLNYVFKIHCMYFVFQLHNFVYR